jgi:hypothetical protein
MLLQFARPQAGELDEADAAELEHHLAGCPECEEHARSERRLDQHLGQAVRQVEVPDRLRSVLLKRLAQERGRWFRKPLRWAVGVAAGVAALVMLGWAVYQWGPNTLPVVEVGEIGHVAIDNPENPPLRESIEEEFQKQGFAVSIPTDLDFDLFQRSYTTEFQGKRVPCLEFKRAGDVDPHGQRDTARVLLLSDKQFNLKNLAGNLPRQRGVLIRKEGDRQAAIIFYTGDNLNWLISPARAL